MGKYVNPFTDHGWKIIFGQEMNKDLIILFLNGLLEGERIVEDISFIDKEIMPEVISGRATIFDILCREPGGAYFVVEVQNRLQDYFLDRGLFYLCRSISMQSKPGRDWHYDYYPVYGIYFLNFTMPSLVKFRTDVILADRETGVQINDKLRQIYLCMPYFTKKQEECQSIIDCWIYCLKYMDILDRMPFESQKAIFDKLFDVAEIAKLSPKELLRYDESLKVYRDYVNTIEYAEKTAKAEGKAEGIAEGTAEGKIEGKRLVAINMKEQGFPVEIIAQCTELSIEEVDMFCNS